MNFILIKLVINKLLEKMEVENPFLTIEKKLNRLEVLMKGLYENKPPKTRITDLPGYVEYRKDKAPRKQSTLYIDLCKGKDVPGAFRTGKRWMFDLDVFDSWLKNKQVEQMAG